MDPLQKFASFWARPFNEDGDVIDWALLTVLIVTIAFLWTRVLRSILE
jgi:hypothetical protein